MNFNETLPLVSILLPVYNGEAFLKESIDSILSQTYSNFELLILNDGSTDSSESICLSYADKRIIYVSHQNMGLAGTLNKGLSLCKGVYIARQDQDDIAHKTRIEKQVCFLEANRSVLLLGTRANIFSKQKVQFKIFNHATKSSVLKFDLPFINPFVHSTIMFRHEAIKKVGNYNTDQASYEDYELWSRFSFMGDVANLSDILLDYRHHEQGLSKNFSNFKEDAILNIGVQNIKKLMGSDDPVYPLLVSLYHERYAAYHGESFKDLRDALHKMYAVLLSQYPQDKILLDKRYKQYVRIIENRLNMVERIKYKNNFVMVFLLKIKNRIRFTTAGLIND